MKKCQAIVVSIIVLISAVGCVPACFATEAVNANKAINQAELSLNSAFVAVAEAYAAGADVGQLLDNLEAAGAFLSEANTAFRSGDCENASSLSAQCKQAVEVLVIEANRLGADAKIAKSGTLLLTAVFSGFLLILLLILGTIGWRSLKKRYLEKVLEARLEVEEAL